MAKRNAIETLTQRIAQLTQKIAEKPRTKQALAQEVAERILSNHTKHQPKQRNAQSSLAEAEEIVENDWKRLQFSLNKPVIQLERCLERALAWLQRAALLEILALLGNLGLILAVLTYFGTEKQRRDAEVYNAWQTITSAHGQPGNGGRIRALEFLNRSPGAHWRRRTFPFCWETKQKGICWLWPQESLQGLDVAGAHLRGINLENADLQGANLHGANLEEANLMGKNSLLMGVNLVGANLVGANFSEADLMGAKLNKALLWETDLAKAGLIGANLERADLWEANLEGANLSDANLAEAKLWGANLKGANLSDANLAGARLVKIEPEYATRELANLAGADLRGANLAGADLGHVDLDRAYLEEYVKMARNPPGIVRMARPDPKSANLVGANLYSAIWIDGKYCLNQDCSQRRPLTEQERAEREEWYGDEEDGES